MGCLLRIGRITAVGAASDGCDRVVLLRRTDGNIPCRRPINLPAHANVIARPQRMQALLTINLLYAYYTVLVIHLQAVLCHSYQESQDGESGGQRQNTRKWQYGAPKTQNQDRST